MGVRWSDLYGVRCLLWRCVLGGAPPGVVGRLVGVGRRWSPRRGMPFLGVGRGVCRGALFLRALVPAHAPSWFLGGFLPPLAEGLGGVGGAEALDRIAEEGLPCRLWHDGLRGGLVWVGGVRVRISSKVCTMCTPSCLPAPPAHFTQRQSSCKAGAHHQARWAGAFGGEGSVPGVLERRGEDVDLRWWWGLAVPGGVGAAVAGAGVGGRVRAEGGTGGGGGHGAAVARLVASG